jgi:hypothetical protein
MHKNLYAALALIFIGAYLLLDNFNVINFSYKTILYVLGLIFWWRFNSSLHPRPSGEASAYRYCYYRYFTLVAIRLAC